MITTQDPVRVRISVTLPAIFPEALAHLLGREEPLSRREIADHFRDYIENELTESVVNRYLSSKAR
jgi:hypothetical protein